MMAPVRSSAPVFTVFRGGDGAADIAQTLPNKVNLASQFSKTSSSELLTFNYASLYLTYYITRWFVRSCPAAWPLVSWA